jgi:hypothetical protein
MSHHNSFSKLPSKPRVRLSPNGEIVLIWENSELALDVRFRIELKESSYSLVDFARDEATTGNGSNFAVKLLDRLAA